MTTREPRVSDSILGRAFQRGLGCAAALMVLMSLIKNNDYHPVFSRQEADSLFKLEILKKYGRGRYADKTKLDDLEEWTDLINNIVTALLGNIQVSMFNQLDDLAKLPSCLTVQESIMRLKMIEDWIYYHKDALTGII